MDCSGDTSLGCGDGNGTSLSEPGTQSTVLNGGFVLAMPTEDQTSGSFTVRLTKTYTP
ncbi:hypothetical protein [Nocardioides sp. B-3]|uniref:hypothetical protein n=1 Tax=Nocardioides sp. B-3 TaxID=2895565 RepID=UPI0021533900|nr:hypothetical protein [Nocardioides sp. B-3]UUZ59773.1 hypothetical protein LP418_01270 [Nocardioides sp. B-3]